MASEKLQIPSTEMLRALRLKIDTPQIFYDNDLQGLAKIMGAPLVEIDLQHVQVELNNSKKHNPSLEAMNCQAVYEAFGSLTPAMATDERIWFSLATDKFREYSFNRWLSDLADDAKPTKIRNHLFASSPRNRFRDHAIARLWWIAHYCDRVVGGVDGQKALDILNLRRRYAGDFLDRTGISSSPGLARAIMRVAHSYRDHLADGGDSEATVKFREIMKEIDLSVGRKALPYPEAEDFEEIVLRRFQSKFGAM